MAKKGGGKIGKLKDPLEANQIFLYRERANFTWLAHACIETKFLQTNMRLKALAEIYRSGKLYMARSRLYRNQVSANKYAFESSRRDLQIGQTLHGSLTLVSKPSFCKQICV